MVDKAQCCQGIRLWEVDRLAVSVPLQFVYSERGLQAVG